MSFISFAMVINIFLLCGMFISATVYGELGMSAEPTEGFSTAVHRHFHSALSEILPKPKAHARSPETLLQSTSAKALPSGYAYVGFSNDPADSKCDKTSIEVGVPANTCVIASDYSYKILLVEDGCAGATVQYYSDTDCTTLIDSQSLDTSEYNGCNEYEGEQNTEIKGMTLTVPVHYWKLHCTAQPTKPIRTQSATVEFYTGDNTCTQYAGFTSLAADVCFPVNSGAFSAALRCSTTNTAKLYQYIGGSCTFAVGSTPYTDSCRKLSPGTLGTASVQPQGGGRSNDDGSSSADDTDDGGSGQLGSFSGEMPELPEMVGYKVSCTAANTNYQGIVSVSQTIAAAPGVYVAYLANIAAYTNTLKQAIAGSLDKAVSAADVYISSVQALALAQNPSTAAAPPTASPVVTAAGTPSSADVALQVVYTVLSYKQGWTNTALASKLKDSIDKGVFNTLLQQFASSEGASSLSSAVSSEVEVTTLTGGGSGDGGGGDGSGEGGSGTDAGASSSLSQTALIGIAAGGGSALLLLLFSLCYICSSSSITQPGSAVKGRDSGLELAELGTRTQPRAGGSQRAAPGIPVPSAPALTTAELPMASAPAQVVVVAKNVRLSV